MVQTAEPGAAARRLSAIVFCDIVDYTALMQEDEGRALRDKDRQRRSLERRVPEHRGRVLQYYGDGALSVFESAIDAVTASIAIQRDLTAEPAVPVRIGIHTGDVVYDSDGVFGDGVNVAARVQSLGSAGSILVSERVQDDIKNQPHLPVSFLGAFELKNVKRPVGVYALAVEGLAIPPSRPSSDRSNAGGRRSVAVLPFANMSPDPENEFFSDGMTEELINALTRVNGLQITARTSSFAFKNTHEDIRSIAQRLDVETVLEGSVRKAGGRVRITAQLIDATTGYHLFSETYDRDLRDIFETQEEIARAIVQAVRGQLSPAQAPVLVTSRTTAESHALYLQGLSEYNRWTPESARRAIGLYELCLEIDPGYAPAWVGLAAAHGWLASLGHASPEATWRIAANAARRAAALDPTLGDAHTALAMVKLFHSWDFEAAWTGIQKALSLSPGSAATRLLFSHYLLITGEKERAIEEVEAAVRLDPLSLPMMQALAGTLVDAGRVTEGLDVIDRILAIEPTFRAAVQLRGIALILVGRADEALQTLDRIIAMTDDPHRWVAERGFACARLGRLDEARGFLAMLEERQRRRPEQSLEFDFFILHTGLGNHEEAAEWLDRAAQRRLVGVLYTLNSSSFAMARENPYWSDVIARHGLSDLVKPPANTPQDGEARLRPRRA